MDFKFGAGRCQAFDREVWLCFWGDGKSHCKRFDRFQYQYQSNRCFFFTLLSKPGWQTENLFFSWDGQKPTTIKNSSGDDLQTLREHYVGGLGQYDGRPIAIAGHAGKETEIYDWNTREWETKTEWKLDFMPGTRLLEFAMISFKKYIVVFGGNFQGMSAQTDKIGTIEW